MAYELFLTTRKPTKIRHAFARNRSADIKLSKTKISKIIQSGESFDFWLGNFGKKGLTNIAIPLARDNLAVLVINLTSNAINKFERKISGKGTIRAGKGFTLFVFNEDMNDIIKIIKSLEDLGVLIDGVTEIVKHEMKKTRRRISQSFVSTFSCLISATSNFFNIKTYKWNRIRMQRMS